MIFWEFHTFKKCQKYPKIKNSELQKWSRWQFFGLQNDQNLFHVKSEWQKNPETSTLCSSKVSCCARDFPASFWLTFSISLKQMIVTAAQAIMRHTLTMKKKWRNLSRKEHSGNLQWEIWKKRLKISWNQSKYIASLAK